MSIFEKEPSLKGTEWHYKMLDMIWHDCEKPKTQCSYFWTVVALTIIFPLWGIWAFFQGKRGLKESMVMTFMSIIIFLLGCLILVGIPVLISMIFGLGWVNFPTDENGVILLNGLYILLYTGLMIDLVILFGISVFGVIKLFKHIINSIHRKINNVPKKENDEYKLTDSFVGWASDKKNKICKQIEYPNE